MTFNKDEDDNGKHLKCSWTLLNGVEIELEKHHQLFHQEFFVKDLVDLFEDSILVVDESQLFQLVYQSSSRLPKFFYRYFALQKMFQKHLVQVSVQGLTPNSQKSVKIVQSESDPYHAECLSLVLTLKNQGFKFGEPSIDPKKYIQAPEVQKKKPVPKQYIPDENVKCTVVRLRGLPWTSTDEDIRKFFELEIAERGILLVLNFHGRSTGEAYVQFKTTEDCEKALAKDRQNMGHRYIEIFPSSQEEMDNSRHIMETELRELGNSTVVRMRGLPTKTPESEVMKFFEPLKIEKVFIIDPINRHGGGGGDAYVKFKDFKTLTEAMKRNKEKIGKRYIELFRSTTAEMKAAQTYIENAAEMKQQQAEQQKKERNDNKNHDRHPPKRRKQRKHHRHPKPRRYQNRRHHHHYNNYQYQPRQMPMDYFVPNYYMPQMAQEQSFSEHVVKLRGLPGSSDEVDIADFFSDLSIVDHGIHLIFDESDLSSTGEAYIEFENAEDAEKALKKHMEKLGEQVIEVFKSSSEEMRKNCGPVYPNIPQPQFFGGGYQNNPQFGNFQHVDLNVTAQEFVPGPSVFSAQEEESGDDVEQPGEEESGDPIAEEQEVE